MMKLFIKKQLNVVDLLNQWLFSISESPKFGRNPEVVKAQDRDRGSGQCHIFEVR